MDVRRHLGNRVADFLEEVEFDRRAAAPIVAGSDLQAGPLALEPVGLVRLVAGRGLVFLIQSLLQAPDHAIRLAPLDPAVPTDPLAVDPARRGTPRGLPASERRRLRAECDSQ